MVTSELRFSGTVDLIGGADDDVFFLLLTRSDSVARGRAERPLPRTS